MNKTIRLVLMLVVVLITVSACKSKQKVTAIPGANTPATTTVTTQPSPVVVTQPTQQVETVAPATPEVTRNETFKPAQGETNLDAMRFKYHVVVGSFSVHDNARALRNTLSNEGNNALVVENDQKMLRVIIASFNDYQQAHARISQIKSRFPDAWVLMQR